MRQRPVDPVKRTRRRMVLWSLPVVLVALFASLKFVSMPLHAQGAIDSYRDGYYETSSEIAGNLLFLNLFEPWIPYFDRGTAYAAGGSYTPATDDLSIALQLAPEEQQCMVRVNLARAWEQQGDYYFDAGYYQGAILLYETARAVIAEGEEAGCFERQEDEEQDQQEQQQPDQSDQDQPPQDGQQGEGDGGNGGQDQGRQQEQIEPGEDPGENLDQADRRTEDKIREAERQRDGQGGQGDQEQQQNGSGDQEQDAQQDAVDRLREQSENAEQERQNEEAEQRGQENNRGYVEKPW